MDQREVINKILQYKMLVADHFDVEKVILFGSHAHGSAHHDSDIDVAVFVNSISGDYLTYIPLLWKLRREIDTRIEPVLIESGKDVSGFADEISKTGILIE